MRLAIAADMLALGDEGAGAEIEIRSSVAAHMGFAPIETVSLSEGSFERIDQGSVNLVLARHHRPRRVVGRGPRRRAARDSARVS